LPERLHRKFQDVETRYRGYYPNSSYGRQGNSIKVRKSDNILSHPEILSMIAPQYFPLYMKKIFTPLLSLTPHPNSIRPNPGVISNVRYGGSAEESFYTHHQATNAITSAAATLFHNARPQAPWRNRFFLTCVSQRGQLYGKSDRWFPG